MVRLALCIGVVALSSIGTVAAAALVDGVTLSFKDLRLNSSTRTLVFSGTVSSGASGDTVDVLGWECGRRAARNDYRVIGSTQTTRGLWQVQNPSADPPYRWTPVGSGTTFRARWKEQLSDPAVFRIPAMIWARRISGQRAWKVHVIGEAPGYVPLTGTVVELQRRVGARWVRYRSARLVHRASFDLGPFNYEAVFSVPARGLRLRAYFPKASARPCFLAAATKPWRS